MVILSECPPIRIWALDIKVILIGGSEYKMPKSTKEKPQTSAQDLEYTGTKQTIALTDDVIVVSGTTEAIYPGVYTVTIALKDQNNRWEDGSAGPITLQWQIKPMVINLPTQSNKLTYKEGVKQSPEWSGLNTTYMQIVGGTQEAEEARTYGIQVELLNPKDSKTGSTIVCYTWPDGSNQVKNVPWTINGVEAQIGQKPVWSLTEWPYDGKEHHPTCTGYDSKTMEITGDYKAKAVGAYTCRVAPKENYMWADGTDNPIVCTWKITPKYISKPTLSDTEFKYDGSTKVIKINDSNVQTTEGTLSAVEVGLYSVGVTPVEGCYWKPENDDITILSRATVFLPWSIVPGVIDEAPIIEPMDYTGEEQEPTFKNHIPGMFELSGETSSSEPGEHILLVKPTKNYTWADGTRSTREVTYQINIPGTDGSSSQDKPTTFTGGIPETPKPTSPYTAESKPAIEQKRQEIVQAMKAVDGDLRRTLHANGVFYLEDMKFNDSFYRYPRNDPYNYVDGAREYLFFTKPDLPLVHDGNASGVDSFLTAPAKNIPYFTDLAESPGYRKSVFCNLSYSGTKRSDGCPFMRILSNRKVSNMDIPDLQVEELETAVNMYGTKILYPKSSSSSDEGVDFNIEFQDTRFCEIYHLFKVWDYYRTLKWYGVVSPASFLQEYGENKTYRGVFDSAMHALGRDIMESTHSYSGAEGDYVNYLFYKVLHDHIRVFKFLIDNDGETVLYAASAIGCYPKTIQRSAFSEIPERGPLNINIGFKVSGWFEDNITNVVQDFNAIVGSWKTKQECYDNEWPIYDPTIGFVSQELVDVPFIVKVSPVSASEGNPGRNTEFARYLFKWARFDSKSGTNQNYNIESSGTSSSWADFQRAEDTNTATEPMTNVMAPNGQMVTQNDWDYLANQNYDEDAIRTMLFTSDKYKDPNVTA